jgi:hypothetical protein
MLQSNTPNYFMKPPITKHFFAVVAGTALLLLAGSLPAAAQKTWSFGPELGLSFSRFSGDVSGQQQNQTGLLAGGHVTHSIWQTFGFTFKALYHQRGSQQEINNVLNRQALNYLEVPLMGRFFLTRSGKFRPNLFAGTSFAFLLKGYTNAGDDAYTPMPDALWANYNKFDLGFTAGVGLNYLIAPETRLLLDTRYLYGLSDLNKQPQLSMHNRGLALSLGLSFGLKR